jgi:hypothetical protein
MATIVFDTRHLPLLISRFPSTWDERELDAYFSAFVALHDRGQPFVHISDISLAENMSKAGMRKKAGDFMAAERERSARLCKGAVQVAPGAVVRGAITAIQWVTPPPYPHAAVATWDEALPWVKARAQEAGLTLRPCPPTSPAPRDVDVTASSRCRPASGLR